MTAAAAAEPADDPAPFDISHLPDGRQRASNGTRSVLLEGAGAGARLFRRRAVRGFGSPAAQLVEWVVAELDGVRVYVDADSVIVTRRDLNP